METYWITVTARIVGVRISAFDVAYGGGNTTGSKVASEDVPRYDTDEHMVREFVSRHFGRSFDIRKGDVRSLFIVTVY
jgi:hypothetical protein